MKETGTDVCIITSNEQTSGSCGNDSAQMANYML